jgi:hypothetical protein
MLNFTSTSISCEDYLASVQPAGNHINDHQHQQLLNEKRAKKKSKK